MNRMSKIALGLSLAIGMAYGTMSGTAVNTAQAAGGVVAPRQQALTIFLADPELGVAGAYRANGKAVYFEGRRATDPLTGAPGALGLRFVDEQGRTLALGGEPLDKRWVPKAHEFTAADAGADLQLLAGLGRALQSASLHAAVSTEKSALADLAMQTAGTPAARLPVRAAVNPRRSAAVDLGQMASFYAGAARSLQVRRDGKGALQASLGNGIVLQRTQQLVMEPDENGRMGRIDAYSMVRARDGHVLSAEFGGDNIPDGWAAELEKDTTRDHVSIATDFGRAATALQALAYSGRAGKATSPSDRSEYEAMQRLARSMASSLLPDRDDAASPATATATTSDFTTASTTPYQTKIEVHKKPYYVIAEHSGTRVVKYRWSGTSRTVTGTISFCNHGACPYTSDMRLKCTYTGPRLSYYRVPVKQSDGGTCATPYWAVAALGHHNCHDDSSVQVRAVRGLSYSTTDGRCGSYAFSAYAPACDGS